ncbi:MAG: class I SAM-dependent methyltransferase [Alphaproteobacteria bacterium]|nr:class I SAM-dependent methyltransferase [Alphaproteobacteria bacterium]
MAGGSARDWHDAQVAYWAGAGGQSWLKGAVRTEAALAPLGDRALAAAAARPGDHVIDIGCGTGPTSLALALAVAPGGGVLGCDLSPILTDEARRRALAAGVSNVRFAAGDASTYAFQPAAADLLFSRFGVMFFGDPVAAFRHLRGALKPRGRLVFLVWRPFKENGWAFVPFAAAGPLLPQMPRPAPDEPGPFSFGDPERPRALLTQAGFADIRIDPIDATIALSRGGLDEAVESAVEIGPLSRLLKEAPEDVRDRAVAAVRAALARHVTTEGVVLPAACWLITARNSAA